MSCGYGNSTHVVTYSGNFTAPDEGGQSSISLDTIVQSGGPPADSSPVGTAGGGELIFENKIASSNTDVVHFANVSAQSGTATNWYLPGVKEEDSITDNNGSTITTFATLNFNAPGATVTVGWGDGR